MAESYVYAMIAAVAEDQSSLSKQQETDANTTEISVKMESNLYAHWQTVFNNDHYYINHYAKDKNSEKENDWMNQYNIDSASAQESEATQDGIVQAGQQQTSADASNLQMKAQMVQAVNSISSTVSGMLGRITA